MDIWSLLEIDATSDIRTIKRAYASKLKITRPDEHPEAFQELHYAYKAALDYAYYEQQDMSSTQTVAETESNELQAIDESESIPAEAVHTDIQELQTPGEEISIQEQDTETNPLQLEGERLVALANLLLKSNNELHAPESWKFLVHSPYILDDQFNWRLGLEILRLIHSHNQQYANQPLMQIGTGVMSYLDGLFNWKLNRHHVYRYFDEEQFSPLLDKIAEQESLIETQHALDGLRGAKSIKVIETRKQPNTLYYASPIKRFIALAIDATVVLFMLLIMSYFLTKIKYQGQSLDSTGVLIGLVVGSFIYFWTAESSEYQATVGKWAMGLIVTNKDFERLTLMRSFWRSLIFHLSSSFTYITLIINAMMGDKLLHDRITKTYVIDMRRSRQQ